MEQPIKILSTVTTISYRKITPSYKVIVAAGASNDWRPCERKLLVIHVASQLFYKHQSLKGVIYGNEDLVRCSDILIPFDSWPGHPRFLNPYVKTIFAGFAGRSPTSMYLILSTPKLNPKLSPLMT